MNVTLLPDERKWLETMAAAAQLEPSDFIAELIRAEWRRFMHKQEAQK